METRAFGPFVRRKHKAAANTAQWLEPGEQTRYVVFVAGGAASGGESIADVVGGTSTGAPATAPVHMVTLTDRNVRIFKVGTWSEVEGPLASIPLSEARLGIKKAAGGLVRPDLIVNGRSYGLMPFHKNRRDAKLLLEAARKGRGGSGGTGR